eukprot:TRINITY_DN1979_c4_g1_i1.p1 TRINITY_DN1979_c4_g1~~TRINITY_DN1979_c4_g1_i1.p1  ORF type:complete len:752 (+),score=243.30 TRINITY_DN1979_c4_g1_i1:266-2521(+)
MTAMEHKEDGLYPSSSLKDWLTKYGLAQHYSTMGEKAVTLGFLSGLTMRDYADVGVVSMEDRKSLFLLIRDYKKAVEADSATGHRLKDGAQTGADALCLDKCRPLDLVTGKHGSEGIFNREELLAGHGASGGASPKHAAMSAAAAAAAAAEGTFAPEPPVQHADPRELTQTRSGGTTRPGKQRPRITVSVRKRPLTQLEKERGDVDILRMESNSVIVGAQRMRVDLSQYTDEHVFTFDKVFNTDADNDYVYERTARPLIDTVFEGGRSTCFAYGQTGSGKTYTMLGKGTSSGRGLYAQAAKDIFDRLRPPQTITCNYYEIYGNKCYDLLRGRAKVECREDSKHQVVICGLTDHKVTSVQDMLHIIEDGNSVRAQGSTSANIDSSRSHAVLSINVRNPARSKKPGQDDLYGRFSFIDLAGSERGSDAASSDKITRVEGSDINKSLLALKECIRALDQAARHVPFRGSKLTEVLRESFQGNSRTAMIACVAPGNAASEDTLNTLRYADRVKSLRAGSSSATPDFNPITMMGSDKSRNRRQLRRAGRQESPPKDAQPTPQQPPRRRSEPARGAGVPSGGLSGTQRAPRPASGHVGRSAPAEKRRPAAEAEQAPGLSSSPETHPAAPPLDDCSTDTVDFESLNQADLERQHERLIQKILEEEEDMIASHRAHVDEVMELIRQEMAELNSVDQPGSSIDAYIRNLDNILKMKQAKITALRDRLQGFKRNLRLEERLSQHFSGAEASWDGADPRSRP